MRRGCFKIGTSGVEILDPDPPIATRRVGGAHVAHTETVRRLDCQSKRLCHVPHVDVLPAKVDELQIAVQLRSEHA